MLVQMQATAPEAENSDFTILETLFSTHANIEFLNQENEIVYLSKEIPSYLHELLFLDVECIELGFGPSNIPWLIGLAEFTQKGIRVRQLLAKHPIAEVDSLQVLDEIWKQKQKIVSYNGKSFDIPLIRSRFEYFCADHRDLNFHHFDLYHIIKRLHWQSRYRLIDTEREFLNFFRKDDIPGSYSGQAYFEYQKFGKRALMDKIIDHNQLDLLSMASIVVKLANLQKIPNAYFEHIRFYSLLPFPFEQELKNRIQYQCKSARDWRDLAKLFQKQNKIRSALYCLWRAYRLGQKSALIEILKKCKKRSTLLPFGKKLFNYALKREEANMQEKILHFSDHYMY